MRPGTIVADRFEITAIAGTGGMGTVYRAVDRVAGGEVALKTLSVVGERDAARFVREATVLAGLAHPGIVRYIAHGLTAGHEHYIVMEWLEGETLHDRLQRGRLAIADVIVVGRALAAALGAAHRVGVVHRDIKPVNLIAPAGDLARIKLLDFGIARHIDQAGQLTNTGTVIGTPGYMAPEQVRGATMLDARTDVFALGCVLYRCLTGTSAFGGDQSLAVLAKILIEDVIPPHEIVPAVPPALEALVLRMLAKSPAERPGDGAEVAAALAGLADATAPDALLPTARDGARSSIATAPTYSTQSDSARDTPASQLTTAEQRLISLVLSGGLPGGTEPGRDRLATIATAFGGRLEMLSDGANLVLFAHAGVATDHAIRAARCALALREAMPNAPFVVASGRADVERQVVGDVIDRAANVLAATAPGQIAIDAATANLLGDRFHVHERDERRFLRGVRDGNEPRRTVLGKSTPLVGRDRELALLESTWVECVEERVARAVLVTAPPGGGKTRLRQELVRRVLQRDEQCEVLTGRGDSLRAGSPFAILGDAIRRAAGVREGSSLDDQRACLEARIARHLGGPEGGRITHLLGELTGVAFPSDASEALKAARADPQVKSDAMRTAWVEWLAAECAHHPVLLVLEDLHWGDRPTIDHVDVALRELANQPLMVVALARPEVRDTFPKLWAEREVGELRLPPLTKKASDKLVRDLLGDGVDATIAGRIVERSAGNAFFLEELIRAVAEGRGDMLPDSVLSILQLRLDALGPAAKRALRAASVFGQTFWRGGVHAMLGASPREELAHLAERELIAVQAESRIPGEVEYTFRHDLVREAAYAIMGAADRVLAHRIAGRWLAEHGHADALELAQHFHQGEDLVSAATCYARAAEQAVAGNDCAAAIAHVERGLGCDPPREVAARLHLARAEAHNWRGEHALAAAPAEQALALSPRGSTGWFRAVDERCYAAGRTGHQARAIEMLRELTTTSAEPGAELEQVRGLARAAIVMLRFGPPGVGAVLAERCEQLAAGVVVDLSIEQRLCTLRSMLARGRGEAVRAIELHRAALDACLATHNLREAAFTCLAWAGIYDELGAPGEAVPLLDRGIELAAKVDASTVTSLLYFSLAMVQVDLGDHAAAERSAHVSLARAAGLDPAVEGLAYWTLARSLLARRRVPEARDAIAASLDRLATFADYRAIARATEALVALALGDIAAARAASDAAKRGMQPQHGFEEGESYIRFVELEVLEAAGDLAALGEAAAVAIARLETRSARIEEPWRSRFLARPHHAATLARRAPGVGLQR